LFSEAGSIGSFAVEGNQMKRIVIPVKIGLVAGVVTVLFGPMLSVGRLPFGDIALLGAFFVVVPAALLSLILLALPSTVSSLKVRI